MRSLARRSPVRKPDCQTGQLISEVFSVKWRVAVPRKLRCSAPSVLVPELVAGLKAHLRGLSGAQTLFTCAA